jgi:hypothetical protein
MPLQIMNLPGINAVQWQFPPKNPLYTSKKLRNQRNVAFSDKQDSAPVMLEEGASRALRCFFTFQAFSF